MSNFLQAEDTINGAEGTATAVINGRVEELFEVRNVTATIDLNKADIKTLGKRMIQKKVINGSGTGLMNVYYVTSRCGKMAINYLRTGKLPKFDLNLKNEDPSSATGKQVVSLKGCLLDGADIAKLDVDSDALEQTVNFTFDDADILEEFTAL